MSPGYIFPMLGCIILVLTNFGFSVSDILCFESKQAYKKGPSRYDYAASDSRGRILDNSRDMYGAKGILIKDKDKYLLVPCDKTEKWIDISLAEDILIDEVMFTQGEIYSSAFKEVEIWYSFHYPTETWELLSTVILKPEPSPQKFQVNNVWVRFLKLILKSHYGNEYYCTLSQFSVYGTTVLQNLNEDYLAKSLEIKERLSSLPEMILEDEEFVMNENYTNWIMEESNEELSEENVFDNNNGEDICSELYSQNLACSRERNTVRAITVKKDTNERPNVFTEIIQHMAQTELKLEVINRYITYFSEAIKRNSTALNELRQKSDFSEIKTRSQSYQIHTLTESIDKLKNQLGETTNEFNDMQQQLFFLQYLLTMVTFLLIAVLVLFALHLNYSNFKIDDSEIFSDKDIIKEKKKKSIRRVETKSSSCTSDEEKYLINAMWNKRSGRKALSRKDKI